MLRWPKQQSFGCNGLLMMIMKMLSEHLQEIYPYSESLVFKTVNWPGTNILVFSMYTVLLQLSEGSKYLKRITNFRKRKRTLFGESCFLGSSSTLQKGFYLLKNCPYSVWTSAWCYFYWWQSPFYFTHTNIMIVFFIILLQSKKGKGRS